MGAERANPALMGALSEKSAALMPNIKSAELLTIMKMCTGTHKKE